MTLVPFGKAGQIFSRQSKHLACHPISPLLASSSPFQSQTGIHRPCSDMDEAPRPCPSGLFFHIIGAHENSARQRQLGTGSCSCDTMLSSTSGCHNILQAHAFGNHRLRNSVVHLVCSTMIQILPLQDIEKIYSKVRELR
uniref:Uncharacterized protein n=1 Tax=Salix viminalis TaxID=40686 RepID=A0A6N2NBN4_SALVM